MLLSAVSVLVVVQSSSEIPAGLMNNPVLCTDDGYPKLKTNICELILDSYKYIPLA